MFLSQLPLFCMPTDPGMSVIFIPAVSFHSWNHIWLSLEQLHEKLRGFYSLHDYFGPRPLNTVGV